MPGRQVSNAGARIVEATYSSPMIGESQLHELLRRVVAANRGGGSRACLPSWLRSEPGALLWRLYQAWLRRDKRGTHSVELLRQELSKRYAPIPSLNARLYGQSPVGKAEAEILLRVLLETWNLGLPEFQESSSDSKLRLTETPDSSPRSEGTLSSIEEIVDACLAESFRSGAEQIFIREAYGLNPEEFLRTQANSRAILMPVHFQAVREFDPVEVIRNIRDQCSDIFQYAADSYSDRRPVCIFTFRVDDPTPTFEFDASLFAFQLYLNALRSWQVLEERNGSDENWRRQVLSRCAFAVHNLPAGFAHGDLPSNKARPRKTRAQSRSVTREWSLPPPEWLVPHELPSGLRASLKKKLPRKARGQLSALQVVITFSNPQGNIQSSPTPDASELVDAGLRYWIVPDVETRERADPMSYRILEANASPGMNYDYAYTLVYRASCYVLGLTDDTQAAQYGLAFQTLRENRWSVLPAQKLLAIPPT